MRDIDDNKFWLSVWLLVAIALILMFFIVAGYYMDRNKLIVQSNDPLVVACALSDHDSKPCMAYMGSLK